VSTPRDRHDSCEHDTVSRRAASASSELVLEPTVARIGSVHLAVTDRERALAFWTKVLGLELLGGSGSELRLGIGRRELIVLHAEAARPVQPNTTGLYHVAIHVPTRRELARAIARLDAYRYPNSPTDHTVTETTYLRDPDGIGIEFTLETPERGEMVLVDGTPITRDRDGTVRDPRSALDVEELFAELEADADLAAPLARPWVGHVHLHVADLEKALRFYVDALGLEEYWHLPQFRMADVTVAGHVPHLIALNTWAGEGAPSGPVDAAGLRFYTLELPNERALGTLVERLARSGVTPTRVDSALFVDDPAGNRIRLDHGRPW
jgi:catechol 2,3-dioxygenase